MGESPEIVMFPVLSLVSKGSVRDAGSTVSAAAAVVVLAEVPGVVSVSVVAAVAVIVVVGRCVGSLSFPDEQDAASMASIAAVAANAVFVFFIAELLKKKGLYVFYHTRLPDYPRQAVSGSKIAVCPPRRYATKIVRYTLLAAAAIAAALIAATATSNPASAHSHINGIGDGSDEQRLWDTDNLKLTIGGTNYTARSFAIPHYSDSASSAQDSANIRPGNIQTTIDTPVANLSACQAGVMDGFFQNQSTQPRNDLPVLEKNNGVWEETTGHSCTSFVAAQERAVSDFTFGLYWLDSGGNLRSGGFGNWMWPGRSASPLRGVSYTTWAGKGDSYSVTRIGNNYQIQVVAPAADDEGYIARIDYRPEISLGTQGRTVGEPSQGLSFPSPEVRHGYVTGDSPQIYRGTYDAARHGDSAGAYRHLSHAASLGGDHTGSRCPDGSHPRGEDAAWKIGQGTGRTLSSVNNWTKSQLADIFWCRSDVRYPIRYLPNSITGTTCGTGSGAPSCPSGVAIPTDDFTAWGRVNCYYTALSIDSDGNCVYPHPVPLCTDIDTGAQRYFAAEELATYTIGEAAFTKWLTDTIPISLTRRSLSYPPRAEVVAPSVTRTAPQLDISTSL